MFTDTVVERVGGGVGVTTSPTNLANTPLAGQAACLSFILLLIKTNVGLLLIR